MSQLANLDVDRVDAVDRPANETRFLVVKSIDQLAAFQTDDADEMLANAQQLAEKVQKFVGQLASSGWVAKSDAEAAAANEVAKLVGFEELSFVAKSILNPGAPDPEDDLDPKTHTLDKALLQLARLQQANTRMMEQLPAVICKSIAETFQASEPRAPGRSAQLNGQDSVRKSSTPKLGEGMFADAFGINLEGVR